MPPPGGMVGVWGWDTANTAWVKMLVDNLGRVQVDVLTSGLPAGAATEATLGLALAELEDIVDDLGRCYGWTGAAWTPLTVDGVTPSNLRTRLYDGVNPIVSVGTGADIADTNRGLLTQAGVRGWDGAFWKSINAEDNPLDALINARASLSTISKLYGFNGVSWSRLRVESDALFNLRVRLYDGANAITSGLGSTAVLDATASRAIDVRCLPYSRHTAAIYRPILTVGGAGDGGLADWLPAHGIYGFVSGVNYGRIRLTSSYYLKVVRAEAELSTLRRTNVGQVKGSAGHLYWMLLNPSAGSSIVALTDALAGGGVVKVDHFDTARDGHMITFDPPFPFSTGIYLETFTNMTSVTFGYI